MVKFQPGPDAQESKHIQSCTPTSRSAGRQSVIGANAIVPKHFGRMLADKNAARVHDLGSDRFRILTMQFQVFRGEFIANFKCLFNGIGYDRGAIVQRFSRDIGGRKFF